MPNLLVLLVRCTRLDVRCCVDLQYGTAVTIVGRVLHSTTCTTVPTCSYMQDPTSSTPEQPLQRKDFPINTRPPPLASHIAATFFSIVIQCPIKNICWDLGSY